MRAAILLMLLAFGVGASPRALSWAALANLEDPQMLSRTLIWSAAASHQISFCIDISPTDAPRFSVGSVDAQARMAMRLWLDAIHAGSADLVSMVLVSCSDRNLDLMISIAPAAPNLHGGRPIPAVTSIHRDAARSYKWIRINTAFTVESADGIRRGFSDFGETVKAYRGGRLTETQVMQDVSVGRRLSAVEYAKELRQSAEFGHLLSYVTLIHEMGHAFGLCDRYPLEERIREIDHCSRTKRSGPESETTSVMMRPASYLYLTPDDVRGIQALYRELGASVDVGHGSALMPK